MTHPVLCTHKGFEEGFLAVAHNYTTPAHILLTRGPWVAHLRMTVYKGIGKHSSTQSPVINFDRSVGSLRLYMAHVKS